MLSLGLMAALAVACSASASSDTGTLPPTPTVDAALDDGGIVTDSSSERTLPINQGSPLCNAFKWMGCYPDDPKTANAQECNLAPDGGVFNPASGSDKAQLACHVVKMGDQGFGPICTPPGSGGDGAACDRATDCAPGYECVGDGTCRHYCCGGQCNQSSFCDIQPTFDSMLKVPVCMPLRPCTLLDPTGDVCAPNETCSVVRESNGATSCVAIGLRQAGEGCDTDHCANDLVCLGFPGGRTCYALCRTTTRMNDCPPGQSCMGGLPLFPQPGIGICK